MQENISASQQTSFDKRRTQSKNKLEPLANNNHIPMIRQQRDNYLSLEIAADNLLQIDGDTIQRKDTSDSNQDKKNSSQNRIQNLDQIQTPSNQRLLGYEFNDDNLLNESINNENGPINNSGVQNLSGSQRGLFVDYSDQSIGANEKDQSHIMKDEQVQLNKKQRNLLLQDMYSKRKTTTPQDI
ncbi:UNKNOWN [Stylonychia lemnae]|uniref:Uncharacterized protein n=1 Tax=Stylonychia lemnae TaxID=5949 RepID=A0A078AMS2_STYLE|nr:UNKNOWN [Stylonychia lemnae]|eukprot:CDW82173.1 UNKNOWN [Stylonychia lemnae]